MTITDASAFLNDLLSQTKNKSETKVYTCFLKTLTALKNKELSENQLQSIVEHLAILDLKAYTENRKKYIKGKHTELLAFLKNEFSFIPERYYTEKGMAMGMALGVALGTSLGVAIDPKMGISYGISIGIGVGMAIGMMFGAGKDAEAEKQGLVLKTELCKN